MSEHVVRINSKEFFLERLLETFYVRFEGKRYDNLTDLQTDAPLLQDVRHLTQFAIIANFFFTGGEYEFISNPASFKKEYKIIQIKNRHPYGVYDSSSIEEPIIQQQVLIFYVKHRPSGVPYKASCSYPFTDKNQVFTYQLLPQLF